MLELVTLLHGHGGKELEGRVLEDRGIIFVLLLKTVLQIAKDHDTRFGAVWGQVLFALDGHYAHGGNGLGDAFGKTTESAIRLKGDFHAGVVIN